MEAALASDDPFREYRHIEDALSRVMNEKNSFSARWSVGERRAAARTYEKVFQHIGLETTRQTYTLSNDPPWLDVILPRVRGENVIGRLAATTETDTLVVVGAHYDTVKGSPGANDNGSGIAILVAAARHASGLPIRNYDLEFVLFDQEETGSHGSRAYARRLADEGRSVHSVHTIDLLGWDGDGDRLVELDAATRNMANIYEHAAERVGLRIKESRFSSSDHLSFRALGFEASCLSEAVTSGDITPYYHSIEDTADALDIPYVAMATDLVVEVLEDILDDDR